MMATRKWTDTALQNIAGQITLDIMEDIACLGRDEVDPIEWIIATADAENIHDDDRETLFNMMGVTHDDLLVWIEKKFNEPDDD